MWSSETRSTGGGCPAHLRSLLTKTEIECQRRDFPGGAAVKNPPANAKDSGSRPGPG